MTNESRFLSPAEAAAYLHVHANTLSKLRIYGGGPTYLKLSPGRAGKILYRVSDLEDWLASKARRNTSECPTGVAA